MVRLSGLLANRPAAGAAIGARYYATDNQTVYFSAPGGWIADWPLDQSDTVGVISGALASRPSAPAYLGWIFVDTDTGDKYEAFPGAWALLPGGLILLPTTDPHILNALWLDNGIIAVSQG